MNGRSAATICYDKYKERHAEGGFTPRLILGFEPHESPGLSGQHQNRQRHILIRKKCSFNQILTEINKRLRLAKKNKLLGMLPREL